MGKFDKEIKVASWVILDHAMCHHTLISADMDREDDPRLYDTITQIEEYLHDYGLLTHEGGDHLIVTAKGMEFLKENAYLVMAEN